MKLRAFEWAGLVLAVLWTSGTAVAAFDRPDRPTNAVSISESISVQAAGSQGVTPSFVETFDLDAGLNPAVPALSAGSLGPFAENAVLLAGLRDPAASASGLLPSAATRASMPRPRLNELQPVHFPLEALSTTAIVGEDAPIILFNGKRFDPPPVEKQSKTKPLVLFGLGLAVVTLFAVFAPMLITGFTGGGPAKRKGSRR